MVAHCGEVRDINRIVATDAIERHPDDVKYCTIVIHMLPIIGSSRTPDGIYHQTFIQSLSLQVIPG